MGLVYFFECVLHTCTPTQKQQRCGASRMSCVRGTPLPQVCCVRRSRCTGQRHRQTPRRKHTLDYSARVCHLVAVVPGGRVLLPVITVVSPAQVKLNVRLAAPLCEGCACGVSLTSRVPRLSWVLTALQAANFVLWLLQAKYLFMPIGVQFVLMVQVGLLGGASYVNSVSAPTRTCFRDSPASTVERVTAAATLCAVCAPDETPGHPPGGPRARHQHRRAVHQRRHRRGVCV